MHYVWIAVIGLIVGVIAKFVHPGMVVKKPAGSDSGS